MQPSRLSVLAPLFLVTIAAAAAIPAHSQVCPIPDTVPGELPAACRDLPTGPRSEAGVNHVAVPCQQVGSQLTVKGVKELTRVKASELFKILTQGKVGAAKVAKKKAAKGVGMIAAGALTAASCPPIIVEEEFLELDAQERQIAAELLSYHPIDPPNLDFDVADPGDKSSCTIELAIDVDTEDIAEPNRPALYPVESYGPFQERQFLYVDPWGTYPSAARVVTGSLAESLTPEDFCELEKLRQPIENALGLIGEMDPCGLLELPWDFEFSLDDIFPGFLDLMLDALRFGFDLEEVLQGAFMGWAVGNGSLHTCEPGGRCTFEAGDHRLDFIANIHKASPYYPRMGKTRAVRYYQNLRVNEYFPPDIQTGDLEVLFEATSIGGTNVRTQPKQAIPEGSMPDNLPLAFDRSWLGISDNCDPSPAVDLVVPGYLPLGAHTFPVTVTDRNGNQSSVTLTIRVEDTVPPDLLPLDSEGVEVPAGTLTLPFDQIGCDVYLCNEPLDQGSAFGLVLSPPPYFDFASVTPAVTCLATIPGGSPTACDQVSFPIGVASDVEWTLTDPSGNESVSALQVFPRIEGTNMPPVAEMVSYTVGSTNPVAIPLTASDPDFDRPLRFRALSQPALGDLEIDFEAIFQNRYTASGMLGEASSVLEVVFDGGTFNLAADAVSKRIILATDGYAELDKIWETPFEPHSLSLNHGKTQDSGTTEAGTVRSALDGNHNQGQQNGILFAADWDSKKVWHRDNLEWYVVADLSALVSDPQGLLVNTLPNSIGGQGGFSGGSTSLRDLIVTDNGGSEVVVVPLESIGGGRYQLADAVPELRYSLGVAADRAAIAYYDDPDRVSNPREIWLAKQSDGGGSISIQTLGGGSSFSRALDAFVDPDGDGDGLPEIGPLTDIYRPTENVSGGTWHYLRFVGDRDKKVVRLRFKIAEEEVFSRTFLLPFIPIDRVREAADGTIYVLNDSYLYRFDLAGRLLSAVVLYDSSVAQNPVTPNGGEGSWIDFEVLGGEACLLSTGGTNTNAEILCLTVGPGVGNYTSWTKLLDISEAHAITARGQDLFALGLGGVEEVNRDTGALRRVMTRGNASDFPFGDLAVVGSNLFMTNVCDDTLEQYSVSSGSLILVHFPTDLQDFDFNRGAGVCSYQTSAQTTYGQLDLDDATARLLISDNPDRGGRVPRILTFATSSAEFLEEIVPDGDPNNIMSILSPGDFTSVSSFATGADGRFYLAEHLSPHSNQFGRLHVFDGAQFATVECPDPEAECREVTYLPSGVGSDAFDFSASDPFDDRSEPATVTLEVILDTEAPTLDCPAAVEVQGNDTSGYVYDPGALDRILDSGLRSFFTSPSASDNTDLPPLVIDHDAPQPLPYGATSVTFSTADGTGNPASCSRVVTVVDRVPPVFAPVTALTLEAVALQTPTELLPEPLAEDINPVTVSVSPVALPVGTTWVEWTATDSFGNRASLRQLVTITDTTEPQLLAGPGDSFDEGKTSYGVIANGYDTPMAFAEDSENQTLPLFSDAVGLFESSHDTVFVATDAEGSIVLGHAFCLPALGTPRPYGSTFVSCVTRDKEGNSARMEFEFEMVDLDQDADALGASVDPDPRVAGVDFSDVAHGGVTTGRIESLGVLPVDAHDRSAPLVVDGPTLEDGVVVHAQGLRPPAPPEQARRTAIEPSAVSVCDDLLQVSGIDSSTWVDEETEESEEVPDAVTLTCLDLGARAESLAGDQDLVFVLPDYDLLDVTLLAGSTVTLRGWTLIAGANEEALPLQLDNLSHLLFPGETLDLRRLHQPRFDLRLTQDQEPVAPGDTVLHRLIAANYGSVELDDVSFSLTVDETASLDHLDSGPFTCELSGSSLACTLPRLAAGTVHTLTFETTAPPVEGAFEARVEGNAWLGSFLPVTANDVATIRVAQATDLRLRHTASQYVAGVAESLILNFAVTNQGALDAPGTEVLYPVPRGLSFVGSTSCWHARDVVHCDLGTLASGEMAVASIVVVTNASEPSITSTARVGSERAETLEEDNASTILIEVDGRGPQVTELRFDAVNGLADQTLDACRSMAALPGALRIHFDEPMDEPSTADPSVFRVVSAGPDQSFATTTCGLPVDDDVAVEVWSATMLDEARVELSLGTGGSGPGLYRLIACGSLGLEDPQGNALDANRDGVPGDDLHVDFRVDSRNLITNGHFDCGGAGWTIDPPDTEDAFAAFPDIAESPHSGSFLIASDATTDYAIEACVELPEDAGERFMASLGATSVDTQALRLACEFYAQPGCLVPLSRTASLIEPADDSEGTWYRFRRTFDLLGGESATSAACSIRARPSVAAGDLWIDEVRLTPYLFLEGFESGDTTAWGRSVP